MQIDQKTSKMKFWVQPGYEDQLLGAQSANWLELAADDRAVAVKANARRKIWRVDLGELQVYVKRYEAGGAVGWVKRLFRSSPAAVEFRNHQRARVAGVSCPEPLAFAQKGWRGTGGVSILITAAVSPAEALDVYLQKNPLDDELLRLLAEMLGRSHREGLAHPDPHMGNFLIRIRADGQRELILTDLQKLHKNPPSETGRLNRAAKRNLACCYGAVRDYLSPGQGEKFLAEYFAAAGVRDERTVRRLRPEIERIAWKLSLHRWAGRDRRSRQNNRYFRCIQPAKSWRGSVLLTRERPPGEDAGPILEFTPEQWLKALGDPLGLFVGPAIETINDSQDRLIIRRKLKVGQIELDVHCKLFKRAGWLKKPPAQRAYENGFALLTRRIPTVLPLAWLSKQIGPYRSESILITETVREVIGLEEFNKTNGGEEELAQATVKLGAELARHGFVHDDLGPGNILIKCNPEGQKQLLVNHCEDIRKFSWVSSRRRAAMPVRRTSHSIF